MKAFDSKYRIIEQDKEKRELVLNLDDCKRYLIQRMKVGKDQREEFEEYFERIQRMDNQNVIKFFEQYNNGEDKIIVMENCEYGTLDNYMKRNTLNQHFANSMKGDLKNGLEYIEKTMKQSNIQLTMNNILLQKNRESIYPRLKIMIDFDNNKEGNLTEQIKEVMNNIDNNTTKGENIEEKEKEIEEKLKNMYRDAKDVKYIPTKMIHSDSYGKLMEGEIENKKVLIKELYKDQSVGKEVISMMLCDNPNIMKVLDCFKTKKILSFDLMKRRYRTKENTEYLIMEDCEEGDLDAYIKNKELNQKEIEVLFGDLCNGLHHLVIEKQILHRD